MATTGNTLKDIGIIIQEIIKDIGYIHAKSVGETGRRGVSNTREYRIVPSSPTNKKTSDDVWKLFDSKSLKDLKFNQQSPNSSKFSSISFSLQDVNVDVVIAGGANKGESFEKMFLTKLTGQISGGANEKSYGTLLDQLEQANLQFQKSQIVSVKARTGRTEKKGIPIEKLGEIIGDIVIEDEKGTKWYISLKDVNGDTFSSYSGAGSLFNARGDLQERSEGADFLRAFTVDLDTVQQGFDMRGNKVVLRDKIAERKASVGLVDIFRRAWGMNYFYVRRMTGDRWKTFWIDREVLNKLTSNIKVTGVDYPDKNRKQITISCGNGYAKYKVEVRNSKGGEYPNDVKFKILSLNL